MGRAKKGNAKPARAVGLAGVSVQASSKKGELGALPVDALGSAAPLADVAVSQGLNSASRRVFAQGHKYQEGPRYSWLEPAKCKKAPVCKNQGWDNCELASGKHTTPVLTRPRADAPGTPASVIDVTDEESAAEVQAPDVQAEVVIVGGGPHALAALAALNEGAEQKEGSVCVIDPGARFMQSWHSRFDALEINHLRSPAFAHPAAFDPSALVDYAIAEGRTSELIDAPVSGPWLASTDVHKDKMLKALPSMALFRDFCASLEAKLPHTWLSGWTTSVTKDKDTGAFRVSFKPTEKGQRERTVVAKAVILATGPVGKVNVPPPFEPHLSSKLLLHTESLLGEGKGTLSDEITKRCPGESARVLVIGGGISAAQAAIAACRAGHKVVLRSRRPVQTAPFDVGAEWLDMFTALRVRFEFLCLPMERRSMAVRAATPGGSVPDNYMQELHRLAAGEAPCLTLEVDECIDDSTVGLNEEAQHVDVNGEAFGIVILATGVVAAPWCSPLYHSVKALLKACTVDGRPRVDSRLRWAPDEDIFILGTNAVLELGPGGGNLMGAMRGARVVANELANLVGKPADRHGAVRGCISNQYASLGDRVRFGDGGDSEIDFLAQQLHLSPQAETALRKNRKGKHVKSKATPYLDGALKGNLKGQRDPIGHLTTRSRWATYW